MPETNVSVGRRAALDPECEAWLARLLEKAPPLSEKQKDLIAGAFRGVITEKTVRARKTKRQVH